MNGRRYLALTVRICLDLVSGRILRFVFLSLAAITIVGLALYIVISCTPRPNSTDVREWLDSCPCSDGHRDEILQIPIIMPPETWDQWVCRGTRISNVEEGLLLLIEHDPIRKRRAVTALGFVGTSRSVSALIHMLETDKPTVQSDAAEALGWIGDPAATPSLCTATNSPHVNVRANAYVALERMNAPDADTYLRAGMNDPDPFVVACVAAVVRPKGGRWQR
jgi:hypothetical protein